MVLGMFSSIVILSEAKDPIELKGILRFAQDDSSIKRLLNDHQQGVAFHGRPFGDRNFCHGSIR